MFEMQCSRREFIDIVLKRKQAPGAVVNARSTYVPRLEKELLLIWGEDPSYIFSLPNLVLSLIHI